MISSLLWVPRGAPRQYPVRFELSPDEYQRIKLLSDEENQVKKEKSSANGANKSENEDDKPLPDELRMEDYDLEDPVAGLGLDDDADSADDEDQYEMIEQGEFAFAMEDEEDEEDAEDNEVKPTDYMLVAALTEDDFSHLEVHLFTEDGTLFVHHDINLPELPLCLAWLDCPPFRDPNGTQTSIGNYIAVGSFDPAIEIWNLDVLDPLEPSAVLGGKSTSWEDLNQKKKKSDKGSKQKLKQAYKLGSHEDAVMSLSWNRVYRQALASGSADSAVKIWDITTQTCSHTFTHHTDKVQSVLWHWGEGWLLTSGSFDKSVAMLDCRSGQETGRCQFTQEVESLAWNPFDTNLLYCALEDGLVACIDRRRPSEPVLTFNAHEAAVTALSFSAGVPGMLTTASVDKTVRVWDVLGANQSEPHLVAYKSMGVGKLFAMECVRDTETPFLLAAGGDKGILGVWESDELAAVRDYFSSRLHSNTDEVFDETMPPTADEPILHDGSQNEVKQKKDKKKKKLLGPELDTTAADLENDIVEDESWMNAVPISGIPEKVGKKGKIIKSKKI